MVLGRAHFRPPRAELHGRVMISAPVDVCRTQAVTINAAVVADYVAGRLDWLDARAVEAAAERTAPVAEAIRVAKCRFARVHDRLKHS